MRNGIMDCNECLPLVASYHDEELSEAQAAPLRQHLMDCPACRKALAGEKTLRRWFPAPSDEGIQVPDGFAERVARRAFAGDMGSETPELREEVAADAETQTPIFSFVMWSTALAAGLLLMVSGMLFQSRVGDSEVMHAGPKGISLTEILFQATELSDPAGAGELGAASLEDMSDKSTKFPNQVEVREIEPSVELQLLDAGGK
jgi:anti-sigma factor RsiW